MSPYHLSTQDIMARLFEFDRLFYNDQLTENMRSNSGYIVFEGRGYPIDKISSLRRGNDTTVAEFKERCKELDLPVIKNANWTMGELSLACALHHQLGWTRGLRAPNPTVEALSTLLRERSPLQRLIPNHRSPSSVQRKLEDIRTARSTYDSIVTRGGGATLKVVGMYEKDPSLVFRIATDELARALPVDLRFLLDP